MNQRQERINAADLRAVQTEMAGLLFSMNGNAADIFVRAIFSATNKTSQNDEKFHSASGSGLVL